MESEYSDLLANPRTSAGLLSKVFFWWSIPIFRKSDCDELRSSDVFEPLQQDNSENLGDLLESKWKNELKLGDSPSLARALAKAFWVDIFYMGLLIIILGCMKRFLLPFLLNVFLPYFRENSNVPRNDAIIYGISIVFVTVFSSICLLHYFYIGVYCNMKMRVAVSSLIYRKTLRLSQKALSKVSIGKLVNLLSNDIQRLNGVASIHPLWTSPLTAIIYVYMLWVEIGWAGIIGLVTVIILTPIQIYTGKMSATTRFTTATRTDERSRLMNEIVSGVQMIKMYAWKKPFERLIAESRRLELNSVLRSSYIDAFNMTLFLFTTNVAIFCTVVSFISIYGIEQLTLSKVFVASYLFNMISFLMCSALINSIGLTGEMLIAIKRLQKFLKYEENSEIGEFDVTNAELESKNLAISMKNVSAGWSHDENRSNDIDELKPLNVDKSKPFSLCDVNLEVPKGKLVFVIGAVGAGKSTLLNILLKELPLIQGTLKMNGSISYASQSSWTFTSSIRQNIIFGQTMDQSRYDEVIQCTALTRDLNEFNAGDLTLVGDGTLSGGQKARVNLARAMYRKADIYILDDPLSSVDTQVQTHLFNECIGQNGFLAKDNATRVLVAHQLHFMKEADWIIVLKDGTIEVQGDYNTILNSKIDFTYILNEHENKNMLLTNSSSTSNETAIVEKPNEKIQIPKELEASSKGKVKGNMFVNYFKSANMPWMSIILLVLFVLTQVLLSTADVWVSYWIRNEESRQYDTKIIAMNSTNQPSSSVDLWPTKIYMNIYSGIIASLVIVAACRSFLFYTVCVKASQRLHDTMFHGLISTPMKFFRENPVGRIMNRFTKDMGSIDEQLPRTIFEAFQLTFRIIGSILITISTDPKLSIVLIAMSFIFFRIRKKFLKCSQNIMRLEATTKSPVFTHISATLSGLSTVRSFRAQQILKCEFEKHQNLNTGAYYMFIGTINGFRVSVDLLYHIVFGSVIFSILVLNEGTTGDRVGLAITQLLFLAEILSFAIQQSAQIPNQLTSVERVLEYGDLEREKKPKVQQQVAADWPSSGKLEFKNVSFRYSVENEPVLRNLSFCIQPKEKVSIVGRTGAGKSSLIASIFRLAIVDGDILLDDINTSAIDLNILRSRISIIPQEPVLFSGTLRRNLDPFEEYSDEIIWSALEDIGLKDFVSKNKGLQMVVAAHGHNYSTGQRQILCLARAILRRSRIIILDEATANVDHRTDEVIQKTIRDKFSNSTVITVAHRLNTVIDSDRIIVLDAGEVVEIDAPYSLIMNKDGVFRRMVEAMGQSEYERLLSKAKVKFENEQNNQAI